MCCVNTGSFAGSDQQWLLPLISWAIHSLYNLKEKLVCTRVEEDPCELAPILTTWFMSVKSPSVWSIWLEGNTSRKGG